MTVEDRRHVRLGEPQPTREPHLGLAACGEPDAHGPLQLDLRHGRKSYDHTVTGVKKNLYTAAAIIAMTPNRLTGGDLGAVRDYTMAGMAAIDLVRERIATLLYQHKIKPSVFARRIGMSPSWISGFLKGKSGISFAAIDDAAQVFGVEALDMFVDRDLLWQAGSGNLGTRKGVPHDPSERAAYLAKVLEAYDHAAKYLLEVAVEQTPATPRLSGPPPTGKSRRPRKPRRPSVRKGAPR